jgi:hypothetical protein
VFGPTPLPRSFEACLRDAASPDANVRLGALNDLARYDFDDEARRSRAISALEGAILREEDARVRAAAIVAAAEWRATELVTALLVACEDDVPFVGELAVRTLGELRDPRALPKLERLLSDPRPELRFQAIGAWCNMDHEGVRARYEPVLARMRDEANAKVRSMALRVLDERAEREDLGDLRAAVEGFLRRALEEPANALLAGLALAKLGDAEGRRVVAAHVNGRPLPGQVPTEDDREAVLLAGRYRWEECGPALVRRARGIGRFLADTCAMEATIALAALGERRAVDEVCRLVGKTRGPALDALALLVARARVGGARAALEGHRGVSGVVDEALDELAAAEG